VHDESLETDAYAEFIDCWSASTCSDELRLDDMRMFTGFTQFEGFRAERSHEHPAIQAADLVAGAFVRVAVSAFKGAAPEPELLPVARLLEDPGSKYLVHMMATDDFIRRVARP
jgi:hypothetical protein